MKHDDPHTIVMPGAEPVFHRGGKRGVLLIHGFLGSPFEMRHPARALAGAGFTVMAPRLPGHGTTLEDMAACTGRDWLNAARGAYGELAGRCNEVTLVGLSMGGALSILLAAEQAPRRIVLISTPRRVPDRCAVLAPLARPFMKIMPRRDEEKGLDDPDARTVHVCYDSGVPVMAAWHLRRLINAAMRALPRVASDALIMQSRHDRVIPPDSIAYIAARIGSRRAGARLLERGNHTLTADTGREEVARLILEFMEQ